MQILAGIRIVANCSAFPFIILASRSLGPLLMVRIEKNVSKAVQLHVRTKDVFLRSETKRDMG
jgi:hypothetical protein